MLRQLSPKEFYGWEAYYELLEEEQQMSESLKQDYRAATICKTIADVHKGRNQKPYKLEHFLLKYKTETLDAPPAPKPKQTWQQQLNIAKILALAHNKMLVEQGALKKKAH